MKLGKRMLSASLSLLMTVQLLGVAPSAAKAPDLSPQAEPKHGVFVEYFNQYDRVTDYSQDPYSPTPCLEYDYTQYSMTHTGVPADVPVAWSGYADTISAYWAKGQETPGTNGPDMQYDGAYVVGTNYFAVRWTGILTTPDFVGTYYFKANANDGKHFAIYDADGTVLLGEYVHWNGVNAQGAVNTGSANALSGTTDGVKGAMKLVDSQNDIVKIDLGANTQYKVVFEFCERKDTAFGHLQWMYNKSEADVLTQWKTNKTTGQEEKDLSTVIPADFFTMPEEYQGYLVQGYLYDADGNPASSATVTSGDSSYTTKGNGYYRLFVNDTNAEIHAVKGGYTANTTVSVTENSAVVPPLTLTDASLSRYTVTFQAGDDNTQVEVIQGEVVSEPQAPTKDGYVFEGWMLDGQLYNFETPVNTNITLTAQWREVNKVSVTVQVKDADTQLVEGATVTLTGGIMKTTNDNGTASFTDVQEGNYTITVTAPDKRPVTKQITVTKDSTDITCDVELQDAQTLPEKTTTQWTPVDIDITGTVPDGSNAYMDTAGKVKAVFTHEDGTTKINVNAFYRDNGVWTLRFTPNKTGTWTYTVSYDENDSYIYDDARYYAPDSGIPTDESEQYAVQYGAIFDGLTGIVTCTENSNENAHGGVKQDPDDPQHLIYEDGTPYFLMGYEVDWLGIMAAGHENGLEKAKELIDSLAEAGYNEVLMNAFGWDTSWCNGWATTKNGESVDGYDFGPSTVLPWKNSFGTNDNPTLSDTTYKESNQNLIDYTQMNEEYWNVFDQVVACMTEKGITAHIFWKVYNKDVVWENAGQGTNGTGLKTPYLTYADTMYARYFRDRYGAYNVIFDMGKESYNLTWTVDQINYSNGVPDGEGKGFYMDSIIREFRKDGYDRIITIHDWDSYYTYLRNKKGAEENGALNDMMQLYTDQDHSDWLYEKTLNYKNNFPTLPYYNAETDYQWSNEKRVATYSDSREHQSPEYAVLDYCNIIMAGGYFAHYYSMHAWDIVKYDEMPEHTEYMTNLYNFITKTVGTDTWASMKPDDSIIGVTNKQQENRHAMLQEGQNYLVYMGYGSDQQNVVRPEVLNSVTINFDGITTPLTGIWYNVLTGEKLYAGMVTEDGSQTFTWPEFTKSVTAVSYTHLTLPTTQTV